MATQTEPHSFLEVWTPQKVNDDVDPPLAFAKYIHQTLGTPWHTQKDLAALRKKTKEFFERYPPDQYPGVSWYTLCRLVLWCKGGSYKARNWRRPGRIHFVMDAFRDAWSAGALPELDAPKEDRELEALINEALATETRESWRTRLVGALGVDARRKAYDEWLQSR